MPVVRSPTAARTPFRRDGCRVTKTSSCASISRPNRFAEPCDKGGEPAGEAVVLPGLLCRFTLLLCRESPHFSHRLRHRRTLMGSHVFFGSVPPVFWLIHKFRLIQHA